MATSRRVTPPNSRAPTRSSPMSPTRAFAEANPEAIKAFRDSIAEAAAIVNTDRDKASAAISKFTKLPLEIVAKNPPSVSKPELKGDATSPGGSRP